MFSWLRDKTPTTGYNPVHDSESSIIGDSRVHTTSAVSHQKQHPNGRDVFSIFNDLDRSIAF